MDDVEKQVQEIEQPEVQHQGEKAPSSRNLVKIIMGVLAVGAICLFVAAIISGQISIPSDLPEAPTATVKLPEKPVGTTEPSITPEAGDWRARMALAAAPHIERARMQADKIAEVIKRRKWIALAVTIVIVLAIAGAVTGGVLYKQHEQREAVEHAENEAREAVKVEAIKQKEKDERVESDTQTLQEELLLFRTERSVLIVVVVVLALLLIAVSAVFFYHNRKVEGCGFHIS